ncbi:MAG: hypothetical protein IJT94_12235, partial [Oscillibacter sp.]|nr:hypothetical protein [Oscillibacter sp.]
MDPDNRSQTVSVNPNDAQTLTFDNPRLLALTIHKRDSVSSEPLEGAEFAVMEVGGQEIGTFVTGADGSAEVGGLLPGMSVSVKETKAPAGYVKSAAAQSVKMQSGRENSVTFENAPPAKRLNSETHSGDKQTSGWRSLS